MDIVAYIAIGLLIFSLMVYSVLILAMHYSTKLKTIEAETKLHAAEHRNLLVKLKIAETKELDLEDLLVLATKLPDSPSVSTRVE